MRFTQVLVYAFAMILLSVSTASAEPSEDDKLWITAATLNYRNSKILELPRAGGQVDRIYKHLTAIGEQGSPRTAEHYTSSGLPRNFSFGIPYNLYDAKKALLNRFNQDPEGSRTERPLRKGMLPGLDAILKQFQKTSFELRFTGIASTGQPATDIEIHVSTSLDDLRGLLKALGSVGVWSVEASEVGHGMAIGTSTPSIQMMDLGDDARQYIYVYWYAIGDCMAGCAGEYEYYLVEERGSAGPRVSILTPSVATSLIQH
ncbi:MAG: hypothetical protein NDI61_07850 [Bdellovibrionaceae bacterium]|nr:hypothetical protein [Pseudobdellovibrionaceae bacterium]